MTCIQNPPGRGPPGFLPLAAAPTAPPRLPSPLLCCAPATPPSSATLMRPAAPTVPNAKGRGGPLTGGRDTDQKGSFPFRRFLVLFCFWGSLLEAVRAANLGFWVDSEFSCRK